MKLTTVKDTEYRLAKAWYVKYPLDAYALGPYRYESLVPATKAIEDAETQFGEKPREVWPDGQYEDSDEYEIELDVPVEEIEEQ